MAIPLIDGSDMKNQQLEAMISQAKAQLASKISTSEQLGYHLMCLYPDDPDQAAQQLSVFAIGVSNRVIDAFSPKKEWLN